MTVATIHQAKTHLSQYLKELETGKNTSVVIRKYNRPVARIIPFDLSLLPNNSSQRSLKKRSAGMLKGKKLWISEDFDDSLEGDFESPLFPEK